MKLRGRTRSHPGDRLVNSCTTTGLAIAPRRVKTPRDGNGTAGVTETLRRRPGPLRRETNKWAEIIKAAHITVGE